MGTANSHRCFACGTPWEPGDQFCGECGASLGLAQLTLALDAKREPWAAVLPAAPDPAPDTVVIADDPKQPALGSSYLEQVRQAGIDPDAVWTWDIGLGTRVVNALASLDAFLLSEAAVVPAARLLSLRGVGPASLAELRGKAAALLERADEIRDQVGARRGGAGDPAAPVFGGDFLPTLAKLGVDPGQIGLSDLRLSMSNRRLFKWRQLARLDDVAKRTNLELIRWMKEARSDFLDEVWSSGRFWLASLPPPTTHDAILALVAENPAATRPSSAPVTDESTVRAFTRLTTAVDMLPERSRVVVANRFGLDSDRACTLADVAQVLGVTRERIRQIERKAIQVLAHQRGAFVVAHDRIEQLRQELGLSWRDDELALALARVYPRAPWATRGHLRLLAAIFRGRTPADDGVDGVEAAVVAIVARSGPLPLDDLAEQVTPLLDPADLERFPSFSVAKRLELIGPVRRRNDGRYDLPSGVTHGVNDKRVRRLNAMIGVIERLGPSHYTTIARELDDHLPPDYRLSERDVHSWLGRYEDIFVWAGPGRFGLTSHNVGIRASHDPPEAALLNRFRSRRRRGIGDEIALLLVEQGPLPMEAITDHILSRFQVNPASVAAAIHQDSARRFMLTDERLVALRHPSSASPDAPDEPPI